MRWFDKYKGLLRRIRLGYRLANVLNYKSLVPNRAIYKKYGLNQSLTAPISHKILQNAELAEPDIPNYELKGSAYFGYEIHELKKQFDEKGFVVLKKAFSENADSLNAEIEKLLNEGKLGYNFTGIKMVFANRYSQKIRDFISKKDLVSLLSDLLEWEVIPFQTINFKYGSEQAAHSDSIHMATFPEGKLTAAWIALEDIGEDQGPLFYYPGSHKLPYTYNEDLGLKETAFLIDPNPNRKYELKVAQIIEDNRFAPEIFTPEKGDVLIWHPNLLHGGMPHRDKNKTRKSMVIHYFGRDVICYHELTQRPAIIR